MALQRALLCVSGQEGLRDSARSVVLVLPLGTGVRKVVTIRGLSFGHIYTQ